MLDKQIQIISCDTGSFYSNREARLHWRNHQVRVERNNLIEKRKKLEETLEKEHGLALEDLKEIFKDEVDLSEYTEEIQELLKRYKEICGLVKHKTEMAKVTKEKLLKLLENKAEENISNSI